MKWLVGSLDWIQLAALTKAAFTYRARVDIRLSLLLMYLPTFDPSDQHPSRRLTLNLEIALCAFYFLSWFKNIFQLLQILSCLRLGILIMVSTRMLNPDGSPMMDPKILDALLLHHPRRNERIELFSQRISLLFSLSRSPFSLASMLLQLLLWRSLTGLSVRLSVCLSVCTFVCLCVCVYVCRLRSHCYPMVQLNSHMQLFTQRPD